MLACTAYAWRFNGSRPARLQMAAALDAGQGSINAGLTAIQQRLQVLDKEVDVLNGKLDQAFQAWSESGDAVKKQLYDDVKERLAQLNQRRAALESQLAGV